MAINKVVFGDIPIMDITDTSATEDQVAEGQTFYGKDWVKRTGTAKLLPAVTSADDGKILMVVDGQWQPAQLEFEINENGHLVEKINEE